MDPCITLTKEQKQTKILAAIATRGWFTSEIYWDVAHELESAGVIKLGEKFSTGGNRKVVWVAS